MKICATTIVSVNYLAYARVLAQSVATHFPEADFIALVVDRRLPSHARLVEELPFEVVWAEELGLPDLERLAYQFEILELNTCLKPTFLKQLFDRGYDRVIYWDPDIRLYAHPGPIMEALTHASTVLTPHTVKPMMDGRQPSDIDLLRTGCYNLGFVAFRNDPGARALLDWWEDRCLTHGFNDRSLGTFVDQKWMDLAPSYFDAVSILTHRGCNVAYWNLHERRISGDADHLCSENVPLIFFHFSGVSAEFPQKLSKYQTRHELVTGSLLQLMVQDYCRALHECEHHRYAKIPYTFATLTNGVPVSPVMRRALAVVGRTEAQPFDAHSTMQQLLVSLHLAAGKAPTRGRVPQPKTHHAAFNPTDGRVVWFNRLLRILCRIIGVDRLYLVLRYVAFLMRGSNAAAALTDTPFELSNESRQGNIPE